MSYSLRMKLIVAVALTPLFFTACQKTEQCIDSEICLINENQGHVFMYYFDGSSNPDTLFTGDKKCWAIDPVTINSKTGVVTDDVEGVIITPLGNSFSQMFEVVPEACKTNYYVDESDCYDTSTNCSNGELDEDEYDIDCGGIFCDPCNPVIYTCNLSQNTISGLGSGSNTIVSNVSASSNYIYFDAGINHFEFELNSGTISAARRHYFIGYTEVGSFTAKLSQGFFYTYQASADQDVYIEEIGPNTFQLKFCDLKFSYSIDQVYVSGTIIFTL